MKKKIGDLTYREVVEFCKKRDDCKNCPFVRSFLYCSILYYPYDIPDEELDKEVEL